MWAGIELPVPSCDSSLQYYPVQNTAFEAFIPYSLCVIFFRWCIAFREAISCWGLLAIQRCLWGDSIKDTASSKINIKDTISKRKTCTYYCSPSFKPFRLEHFVYLMAMLFTVFLKVCLFLLMKQVIIRRRWKNRSNLSVEVWFDVTQRPLAKEVLVPMQ